MSLFLQAGTRSREKLASRRSRSERKSKQRSASSRYSPLSTWSRSRRRSPQPTDDRRDRDEAPKHPANESESDRAGISASLSPAPKPHSSSHESRLAACWIFQLAAAARWGLAGADSTTTIVNISSWPHGVPPSSSSAEYLCCCCSYVPGETDDDGESPCFLILLSFELDVLVWLRWRGRGLCFVGIHRLVGWKKETCCWLFVCYPAACILLKGVLECWDRSICIGGQNWIIIGMEGIG